MSSNNRLHSIYTFLKRRKIKIIKYISLLQLLLYKNKITRSSIIEYLLLKVKINYTQYFAKNPIGIIRL